MTPPHPMTAAALKAACLELNGAEETFPFGPETSVFKVGGKVFALTALDGAPLKVSLKCDPDLAERLRETHPAIVAGWHLNKRHWNTVTIDGSVPDLLLREMIEDSYDLIVTQLPRKQQLALDWPGTRRGEGERATDGD
jgi:predicted DNA-binding protein (MmcQ/YjbR family)